MRRLLFAILLLSSAACADPVKRYITLNGTRFLSKPTAFSKSYGSLKRGLAVMAEPAGSGYYKVVLANASDLGFSHSTGYVSAKALQSSKPTIGSSASAAQNASAEEVAAATKGFNKQVEAETGKAHPEYNYAQVDQLLKRSTVEDPRENLDGFREKGKLGEYGPSAQEADHE